MLSDNLKFTLYFSNLFILNVPISYFKSKLSGQVVYPWYRIPYNGIHSTGL